VLQAIPVIRATAVTAKPTSPALVQHRIERRMSQLDRRIVNHHAIL
jgi:hypothetical protein